MRRLLLAPLFVVAPAAACSSTGSGTIQLLITDPGTFSAPPPVTRLTVSALDTAGGPPTTLATASLPATTIDLGLQNESNVDAIEITGTDANGIERVFGASLPFQYGQLTGLTLPIFVQRVGQLATMPGGKLSDSRQAPAVGVFEGEYLFVGGGSDASLASTSQIYDFAQFAPLPQPPSLPRAPLSIAFVGTVGWLIDASGSATYFDFSSSTAAAVAPLAGGSFADVAGGATVIADDGTEFVVGATRTGTQTSTVLEIDPNDTSNPAYPYGNARWLSLTEPRLGASATWVTGFGLVVAGGSASASGVEVFAVPQTGTTGATGPVATRATALPYPPDPSAGAGATTLTTNTVLLAGGITPSLQDAGARTIDLGCSSMCAPTPWQASLPVPVVSAQVFTLSPTSGFVIGNEPLSGTTHAFVLTAAAATEIPTAIPHTNATATWSPVGSILLVGGADDIESFVPSPPSP